MCSATPVDSALRDVYERPSSGCSDPDSSTPAISVGSQTTNVSSPAPSVFDTTNENQPPQPIEPIARKGPRMTFPLSAIDERMCHSQIQSLDQAILDKVNPSIMKTESENAAKGEAQPKTQLQPVPDDFKRIDDTRKRELRKETRPDKMSLQLQMLQLQKQAESNPVRDSKQFVKIWELESINVRRGQKPGYRIIDIMTANEVPHHAQKSLHESKDKILCYDNRDIKDLF
ncbi:hypothetical protein F5B20DRAFT_567299 [Whalleya microplaca]|nr:hypothetical protein F5B20DRAFT_567299 [Whalleya microplaca]